MGDLIKDLDGGGGPHSHGSAVAAGSWCSTLQKSRSRHPIVTRLSMSVDSIVPYSCEYEESIDASSREILSSGHVAGGYGCGSDTDEARSLNNILDALHDEEGQRQGQEPYRTELGGSGSWSALLDPQLYDDGNHGHSQVAQPFSLTPAFAFTRLPPPPPPPLLSRLNSDTHSQLLHQLHSTLRSHYTKLVGEWLRACPPYFSRWLGPPPSTPAETEPMVVPCTSTPLTAAAAAGRVPPTTIAYPSSYWLLGRPGSGKTAHCMSLLHKWVQSPPPPPGEPPELLVYLPLFELGQGVSLQSYLKSRLLSSNAKSSSSSWPSAWQIMNGLGPALLLVLDDVHPSELPTPLLEQVQDILNGVLFPGAQLVCTTSSSKVVGALQPGTLRFECSGLSWAQISGLVERRSGAATLRPNHRRHASASASEFLEYVSACPTRRELASSPSTLALLLGGYEQQHQHQRPLGSASTCALYASMIETLFGSTSTSPKKASPSPVKVQRLCELVGRLLLHCSPDSSTEYYAEGELSPVQEAVKRGIFTKSSSSCSSGGGATRYRLVHWSLRNYLIAVHLAATASNNTARFRKEFERVSAAEMDSVLALLVQLLACQPQGQGLELLFSSISLLSVPLQSLLAVECVHEPSTASSLCRLLHRHCLHSATVSDSSWGPLLPCPQCPLRSIDILLRPGELAGLRSFFDSLSANTTIDSVKLSSVPGTEWTGTEVHSIARLLLQLCTEKRRLEALSLHFTLLSERQHSVFQPLVDALAFCIGSGLPAGLRVLSLEMDLAGGQLHQLSNAVASRASSTSALKSLQLPNLCVVEREDGGFSGGVGLAASALTRLVAASGVRELGLQGCWRAAGPGPGPATGVSSYSLRSTSSRSSSIQPSPSPSLSHGSTAGAGAVGGPSLLQPLLNTFPPPSLSSLNLSKASLTASDLQALCAHLRTTSCQLQTLHLEGARLNEVMQVLLQLEGSTNLRTLHLGSHRVQMADESLCRVAGALSRNGSLRKLNVAGWQFRIEDASTLTRLQSLCTSWQLESIDLTGCRFEVKSSAVAAQPTAGGGGGSSSTLKRGLKLFSSTLQLNMAGTSGPVVFPRLVEAGFAAVVVDPPQPQAQPAEPLQLQIIQSLATKSDLLRVLDLSVGRTESPNNLTAPQHLHSSKSYTKLLKRVASGCPLLETLRLCNYRLRVGAAGELSGAVREVFHRLQGLRTLCIDGTEVEHTKAAASSETSSRRGRERTRPRVDNWLLAPLLGGLRSNGAVSVSWTGYSPLSGLMKCLVEIDGVELELQLRGASSEELRGVLTECAAGGHLAVDYAGDGVGATHTLLVRRASHNNSSSGGAGGLPGPERLLRGIRRLF